MGADGACGGLRFVARPGAVWRVVPNRVARRHTQSGRVMLTFDDGPHRDYTPTVLDRLREYGVSATFFVVGNRAQVAPDVVRRISDEGHALGNHTFAHQRHPLPAVRRPWRDLADCQRAVVEAVGETPRSFRPPLGRLTPGILTAAWRHGLPVVMWSLDSNDWRCRSAADADRCAAEVTDAARPGDVILFHDAHPFIGRILDAVLPRLRGRGLLPATRIATEPLAVSS